MPTSHSSRPRGTPPASGDAVLRLSGSLLVLGAVLVVVTTCRDDRGPAAPTAPTIQPATSVAAASGPVTLVGAGNIAKCAATGDDATAVVLNSGSSSLVPTTATSPQVQWLKADLAAHPAHCTLAYWHNPLFDSKDAPNNNIRPLWDALYAGGVDVVVNAHYAFYERFAPQTPAGVADPVLGIREFVVGTGGAEHVNPDHLRANSQARNGTTWGVLKLTLDSASYAWEFVPIAGQTFRDSGTASCHAARPAVSAGPDLTTNPGDTVKLSVTFSDPDPNDGPWTYTIGWGDGTSSAGDATSQTAPISATHVYSAVGLDSVRVTVSNSGGGSGADTVAVAVGAPAVLVGAGACAGG